MFGREIILNLWYVHDYNGIIYSLRAKAYIGEGTEEENLSFLQQRAPLDYLVAEPFEVPERFHMKVDEDGTPIVMPVGHISLLQMLESRIAIFEDAIRTIESRIPAQTKLDISKNPLVCITPLSQNEHELIVPKYSGKIRL